MRIVTIRFPEAKHRRLKNLAEQRGLSAPRRKFGDVFCSAGFQTCCLADFQIRKRPDKGRSADWEVGDTAGLETCVTSSYLRPPALSSVCSPSPRPSPLGRGRTISRRLIVGSVPHFRARAKGL